MFPKSIFGVTLLGAVVGLTGCAAGIRNMGPGGVAPAGWVTNVTYPNRLNPSMDYRIQLTAEDVEMLGRVSASAKSKNILGLVSSGDSGYGALLEQARLRYGADGVMNVTVDTRFFDVLGVYQEVETKLTGMAYRYKNKIGATPNYSRL